jgi:hypothetical protein
LAKDFWILFIVAFDFCFFGFAWTSNCDGNGCSIAAACNCSPCPSNGSFISLSFSSASGAASFSLDKLMFSYTFPFL